MIKHLLLILTLVPTILLGQFTVTTSTESWDKEKKELFCARDQMGVKPFLYYFQDNRLVFSTELKPIVKLPFIKTAMDSLYNRDWAVDLDVKVDRTPWKNILRLKAANLL